MNNKAQITPTEMAGTETKINPADPPGQPPHPDMVWIPGGTFRMGSNDHYQEEAPVHQVTVDGFWMDTTPITCRWTCNIRMKSSSQFGQHRRSRWDLTWTNARDRW